ncbi:MAG: phosphoglycerate kinase [Candidatus Spechtbacterales bacterium]|nr:phosphoglycerate kinase [Candidatus Spechtbacterales bacterium]
MNTVKNLKIKSGERVLLRADFNVSMDKEKITDDFRIRATLPTINYLRDKGAKVIIMAHLGRPGGKYNQEFSLMPVAERLGELLKIDIKFFEGLEIAEGEIDAMEEGDVALLENLRFDKREKEGSKEFAKELAALGDAYINDAFGVAHREHTSVFALPKEIKRSAAGLLLQKEVETLGEVINNPKKPLSFVMGGAKVDTKLKLVSELFSHVDQFCLGGLIANSIMKFQGMEIGRSWHEDDIEDLIKGVDLSHQKLHMPKDVVVSTEDTGKAPARIIDIKDIKKSDMILDAGPDTISEFSNIIKKAGTVVWNGPLGLIEVEEFARGTRQLARSLVRSKAKIIVGGGDLMSVIDDVEATDSIYFASTGGGAMLEFLAEGTLPALEVLR